MKTALGLLPLALHGTALLVTLALAKITDDGFGLVFAAPAYPIALVLAAGLVSRAGIRHIRAGRFVRDPKTSLYRGRMIYGAAWTTVFYCKPILHLMLSCPLLKAMMFRSFGYRGSMRFTTYPDVWMRDLHLLDFGPGTYVANRATLGTNHVRSDGRIEVAGIRTGHDVVIGHLAMVGGGTTIDDRSELGVASKIGFKVRIAARVSVGPGAIVDSGSKLLEGCVIGAAAYIGKRCVIHAGVRVPAGTTVPDRSVVRTSAELERLVGAAAA